MSITVSSVTVSGYDCTNLNGQTLTITGVFTTVSDLFVYDVVLVLGNIVNPVPAVTTGQFSGKIGTDVSVPAGSASITLSPGSFESCAITFDTPIVNKTSTMIITVNPAHELSTSASIVITMPSTRRWTNDISTSNTLPLNSAMGCTSTYSGVSSIPICSGNVISYTITAQTLLTASTSALFGFGVTDFRSPPSLQPSDLITITSYEGTDQVDTCSLYVTGLQENPLTVSITSTDPLNVNAVRVLKFSFTLPDYINNYDDIRITFPSSLAIQYSLVAGIGSYDPALTSVTGQVITIVQKRLVSRLFNPATTYYLNLYNVKLPTSTKVTQDITL